MNEKTLKQIADKIEKRIQSENEKMLMERGYFASEEAIEKEEDLKF